MGFEGLPTQAISSFARTNKLQNLFSWKLHFLPNADFFIALSLRELQVALFASMHGTCRILSAHRTQLLDRIKRQLNVPDDDNGLLLSQAITNHF